ncbi:uncharacterized protein LOC124808488 [Hydra vulgaris]|uniref:uncharacterized protein LOC124808488 n=1 Tax=Hydra vulgaris TaxID=6087 RepID=UPI001F5E3C77|nr:uncharacterized protein LOC124808488 [Hydra vulgaris]
MHNSSQHHIKACAVLEIWKKNKTIDKKAEDEIRYRASFWQMVLERLFRITLMLSTNSLAFRGHLEGFTEDYNGNFLSQVQLLFNYDSVMKQILEMPSGSIRYLSPITQNELIYCLGKKLLNDLIANRFYELKDHSAEGMTNQVLTLLKEAHIPVEKCYGQGYDGANVMSGVYSGVQTRIKQIQPNAENSIKIWDLFSIFTGESEVTLKKLNPTRWSGRLQSLTAVKVRFMDILKALTEIILKSIKKEERDEAL